MLDLIARGFRTLGEPFRLRILQLLECGEMSVGELAEALDGNQPNISDAGLLSRRRERTSIFYAISDPMVFKLCAWVQ